MIGANHAPESNWDPVTDFQFMSRNVRGFMSLFHSEKPVLCKVHGYCVAGGTDMALCSDLLVIAAEAKIGYPPARVWGSPTTAMWAARVGPMRAKRLLLTGDSLTGAQAEEWGLATEAPPAAELDERFEALLERVARMPINQLVMMKMLVNQSSTRRACTRPSCSAPSSTASPATPRRATASSAAPPRRASRRPCASATSPSATSAWRASAYEWPVIRRVRSGLAVVGGGFGGVGAAVMLKREGYEDVTVFEKGERVGGVWQHNTYPGAACDIPSHLYEYSFAPNRWSRRYAPQAEIQAYVEGVARRFGVLDKVRTGTEVKSARWDEERGRWLLETSAGPHEADLLVTACGQLSVPKTPPIPGLDGFEGPAFHTAEWRHDVDLAGKRVAVIGTGCSAIQVVPAIQPEVAQLDVYQRSPGWTLPKMDFEYSPRAPRRLQALPRPAPPRPRLGLRLPGVRRRRA